MTTGGPSSPGLTRGKPAADGPADPIRLVIFDCDGVLIDSEGPSARVCAEEITLLGWPMTQPECMARFIGYRLSDMPPVIEAHTGRPVPDGWIDRLRARMIDAFGQVETMPGVHAALRATTAAGLPWRVASNSSHAEMDAKFAATGLAALVGRRKHSAQDVARGKPHPDVFLAAAAAEGVAPACCLVVEDSLPGMRAAAAAGMRVVALVPDGAPVLPGAQPIRSLAELGPIIQAHLHP